MKHLLFLFLLFSLPGISQQTSVRLSQPLPFFYSDSGSQFVFCGGEWAQDTLSSSWLEGGGNSSIVLTIHEQYNYAQEIEFKVYPNPTSGLVFTETPYDRAEVRDLSGRLMESQKQVDLSRLRTGTYLVTFFFNQTIQTKQIVKL